MKVALCANFGAKCGIAEYSRYLSSALSKLVEVHHCRYPSGARGYDVVHIQHEFALFRPPRLRFPASARVRVVTYHTVVDRPRIEYGLLAAYAKVHIVHTPQQKTVLKKRFWRPVHVVPHGSTIFNVEKEDARKRLNLPMENRILFSFGFAANAGRGYKDLVDAMKEVVGSNPTALLILAAAPHFSGGGRTFVAQVGHHIARSNLSKNVVVLNKFLSDEEINLYAAAADLLVFNYRGDANCFSASGALHRVAAAGRPVLYSGSDRRFSELTDGVHGLAIQPGDVGGITHRILKVLEDEGLSKRLAQNIRQFAEATSWEKVAKMHLDLYR